MIDTPHSGNRRNRTLLLVIAAIFFGGMLLAGALRFSGWRPSGLKNHGELLQPPVDLRARTPKLASGQEYLWQPDTRVWRIVVAPPARCTQACTKIADDVDLVWRLMGNDADRVHVLWLCPDVACAPPPPLRDDPNLRVLRPDPALRSALPRLDGKSENRVPDAPVHDIPADAIPIYVIDPNGFVILRYPPGSDPGGLRADLARLLKLM